MAIRALFPTLVLEERLAGIDLDRYNQALADECRSLAASDLVGQRWSAQNYLGGYTSYGSLDRLHLVSSLFAQLRRRIDPRVKTFARALVSEGARLRAFVDLDPDKIGQEVAGVPVIAPDAVAAYRGALCVAAVGQPGARAQIRAALSERAWEEGRDFVAVA